MNARDATAFRSLDKADAMASRAAEIDRQAAHAIYDDDPDAVPRLRARIAELETKRDAMKAANVAYRKAHPELRAMTPYQRSQAVPFPGYAVANITGNVSRLRERRAYLERKAGGPDDPR